MEGLDAVEPYPRLEIHVPVICVVFVGCGVFKRAVGRGQPFTTPMGLCLTTFLAKPT